MDQTVYKIRYKLPNGRTQTQNYSDPRRAEQLVAQARADGCLLFFGVYELKEDRT